MRALLIDKLALEEISPASISAFARQNGWVKEREYRERADIYVNPDLGSILLPRTKRLADYAQIVSNILEVFSNQLQIDQLQVYNGLIYSESDLFRTRAITGEDDGTIHIDAGVELHLQAREVFRAAACSVTSPQAVYRAGAVREANDFMKRVRLGQSQHGSYIVNLITKVPPLLQMPLAQEWVEFSEEPYERQVTRRMAESIVYLRRGAEAAIGGDGESAFEGAVNHGVSANLCEAVARMLDVSGKLDFSISWAETRPAPEAGPIVQFSEDDAGIFREAARKLREKRPKPDVVLYGVVHKLSRSPEKDDGTVTLRAEIDGDVQSVSAVLTQQDYESAVRAHGAKNPIVASGDLERIGQRWRLTNGTIRVLNAQSEDEEEERE